VASVALRVLSWNLMHGRAVPSAGHDLLAEFAEALSGWEWDLALLQEVPPWWPALLGEALGASARLVLTSRNSLLPLRRAVATRWPDAIKSNGGGANAILARGPAIALHRTRRLCIRPERRWVHAVALDCGVWVANLHATVHDEAAALRDGRLAAKAVLRWAGVRRGVATDAAGGAGAGGAAAVGAAGVGEPAAVVLGGDFNVRELSLPGFVHAGGHDVDHVFVRGLAVRGRCETLERGRLSDHAPVLVTLGGGEEDETAQKVPNIGTFRAVWPT